MFRAYARGFTHIISFNPNKNLPEYRLTSPFLQGKKLRLSDIAVWSDSKRRMQFIALMCGSQLSVYKARVLCQSLLIEGNPEMKQLWVPLAVFLVRVCYMVLNCVQKFIKYKHTFSATLTFKYANTNKRPLDPPKRILMWKIQMTHVQKGIFCFIYKDSLPGIAKLLCN